MGLIQASNPDYLRGDSLLPTVKTPVLAEKQEPEPALEPAPVPAELGCNCPLCDLSAKVYNRCLEASRSNEPEKIEAFFRECAICQQTGKSLIEPGQIPLPYCIRIAACAEKALRADGGLRSPVSVLKDAHAQGAMSEPGKFLKKISAYLLENNEQIIQDLSAMATDESVVLDFLRLRYGLTSVQVRARMVSFVKACIDACLSKDVKSDPPMLPKIIHLFALISKEGLMSNCKNFYSEIFKDGTYLNHGMMEMLTLLNVPAPSINEIRRIILSCMGRSDIGSYGFCAFLEFIISDEIIASEDILYINELFIFASPQGHNMGGGCAAYVPSLHPRAHDFYGVLGKKNVTPVLFSKLLASNYRAGNTGFMQEICNVMPKTDPAVIGEFYTRVLEEFLSEESALDCANAFLGLLPTDILNAMHLYISENTCPDLNFADYLQLELLVRDCLKPK